MICMDIYLRTLYTAVELTAEPASVVAVSTELFASLEVRRCYRDLL